MTGKKSHKQHPLPTPIAWIVLFFGIAGIALYVLTHITLLSYAFQAMTKQVKPLCPNCNVVIVSLDTLSALHLPCYGYKKNTAPNLCAFAKNHVWFPNAYAQSFFTLPSHASLFTSTYPSTHGMLETQQDHSLDASQLTLAEVLQRRGYNTLYFGPVESRQLPLDRGFGRGFDFISPSYSYDRKNWIENWKKGIDMLKVNQTNGKPTFLFLHTYYLHDPYLPGTRALHFTNDSVPDIPVTEDEYLDLPPKFIEYAKDFFHQNPPPGIINPSLIAKYRQFLTTKDYDKSIATYADLINTDCSDFCLMGYFYYQKNRWDEQKVSYIGALYDELILQLDAQIAPLLAEGSPLLAEDTILIITADHGEGFMEHGALGHHTLHNEVLRVPLIMALPHAAKRAVSALAETIDIYPTILRLVGIATPNTIEGADLTEAALGVPFAKTKPEIISELFDKVPGVRMLVPIQQKAIANNRWKLIAKNVQDLDTIQNLELYDVRRDPWDTTNVISRHPTVAKELTEKLRQFMRLHPVTYPAPTGAPTQMLPKQDQKYFRY